MNNIIKFSELENNPEEVERVFSLDNEKVKLSQMFYNVPEELKNEKIIILKDLNIWNKNALLRKALINYKEEELEIGFCLKVGDTFDSYGCIDIYEIIYLPYSRSEYGDFKYTFIDLVKYNSLFLERYLEKYLSAGIYSGIPYDLEDTDEPRYILINKVRAKDLESIVKNQVTELISNMDVINKNFSVIGIKIIK